MWCHLVVLNLLREPETTGIGLKRILKTGGDVGATWIWQVGQVCLVQWPCSVDMQVFTRECLYPRRADASAVTAYFMLLSQLDMAGHVLANCTWLRLPTKS